MNRPLIIAHRGASGEAPENTLKAFDLAYKQGADGIELDIILTKDKHIVISHDENLIRLTGRFYNVRDCTLNEIKSLDVVGGEKIATLREVFENFGDKFSMMNIEIKPTGYYTDGIEPHLITLIKEFKLEDKIYVSSFNPLHLLRMKKLAPSIKRGFLIWPKNWMARRAFLIRMSQCVSINLDYRWCTPDRLTYYQKIQKNIWVWTVNELDDLNKWSKMPVQAIITNYPGRLKKLLTYDQAREN